MRKAFIETLEKEASKNPKIFLLTADLGFMLFENFEKRFPKRFINVGVGEANMIGAASGLALSGKIPIVYSIGNFVTLRVLEQIRNDICYQNANVKIVSVGAGFGYGLDGPTHYVIEDITVMRSLPNIVIISPVDPLEVKLATEAAIRHKGPVYLRLGKTGEPAIHKNKPNFVIGRGVVLQNGKDATIISTGGITYNAVVAAKKLAKKGFQIKVISMHTIKPLDEQLVIKTALETKRIFSLEEHSIIGGLGGAVAEVLAESSLKNIFFKKLGAPDRCLRTVGTREYLLDKFLLSAEKIAETIEKALKK